MAFTAVGSASISLLENAVEEFIQNGSNYQLYSIKGMKIDIDVYRPLRGSSYLDLPLIH